MHPPTHRNQSGLHLLWGCVLHVLEAAMLSKKCVSNARTWRNTEKSISLHKVFTRILGKLELNDPVQSASRFQLSAVLDSGGKPKSLGDIQL